MAAEYEEGQKVTGVKTSWAWHDNCELTYRGTSKNGCEYIRNWWCDSHGQWTHQFPIKTIFIFNDGFAIIKEKKQLSEDKDSRNN